MNIGEFIEAIEPHINKGINRCCFRGQSKQWAILPKAYRPEFAGQNGSFVKFADSRLHQWKAEAVPYLYELGVKLSSQWDQMAVAQHCGLSTRLLDWSSNPLVTLFFAVIDDELKDGELLIWNFSKSIYNPQMPPKNENRVVLFRPPPILPRLKFQQGLLSYHPAPDSNIPSEQLTKVTISKKDKVKFQNQLHQWGVHHESIYVTLDHLAQKINWISINHMRGA